MKATRDRVVKQAVDSLKRGVPDEPILKRILMETSYSLAGARELLREAKMRKEMQSEAAE